MRYCTSKLKTLLLTEKLHYAIHFFVVTRNVCPLAIPESFAHNKGLRLVEIVHYRAVPFRARLIINSVFGRLCRRTVSRGREDERVWYQEMMFSQVASYNFPLHPRVVRSDSIIGVTL